MDGLEEIALPVRREMMEREAALGGVRFLGLPGERSDEVAVVKLDLDRKAGACVHHESLAALYGRTARFS